MDMNKFFDKFFEETKAEFTDLLKNKNINRLFELIEKINTSENIEKDLNSLNYSQILYNIKHKLYKSINNNY